MQHVAGKACIRRVRPPQREEVEQRTRVFEGAMRIWDRDGTTIMRTIGSDAELLERSLTMSRLKSGVHNTGVLELVDTRSEGLVAHWVGKDGPVRHITF